MTEATQLGLFGRGRVPKKPPSEQAKHLRRVSDRIASHVLLFVDVHGVGGRFHMVELVAHVTTLMAGEYFAPDSPSRILRSLRQAKVLDYRVVSRKDSLYEVVGVQPVETDSG